METYDTKCDCLHIGTTKHKPIKPIKASYTSTITTLCKSTDIFG